MKKVFSILAFLLIFAAGTMAQPTDVVAFITPTDTIDITLDNGMRNEVYDQGVWFLVLGTDSSFAYNLQLAVYSDQIAGSYTSLDVIDYLTEFYYYEDVINIREFRDFTVTGNANNCSTYLEIVSSDSVLYRMTFVNPGVYRTVTPVDTVDITMNSQRNYIFDGTTNSGFCQLHGYDLNDEYSLNLGVITNKIPGSYTHSDLTTLYTFFLHTVGGDTTIINMSDVRDFTITDNSTTYSSYIEVVSFDSVLYRVNYVCNKRHAGVDNTAETEYVVYNEGNVIVVNGAEDETMTVYDMAGKVISSKKAVSDVERIEIAVPGVYVIRIGNKTYKALTK